MPFDKIEPHDYIPVNLRRLFLLLAIPTLFSLTGLGAVILECGLWGHRHLHHGLVTMPNPGPIGEDCTTCRVLEHGKKIADTNGSRLFKIQKIESCDAPTRGTEHPPARSRLFPPPLTPFVDLVTSVPTPPPKTVS